MNFYENHGKGIINHLYTIYTMEFEDSGYIYQWEISELS